MSSLYKVPLENGHFEQILCEEFQLLWKPFSSIVRITQDAR
jgi:hypothetical protein